jgi:hypothetical protein
MLKNIFINYYNYDAQNNPCVHYLNVSLETKAGTTKDIAMSHYQNAGQNLNIY